jgi:hypothetical protein
VTAAWAATLWPIIAILFPFTDQLGGAAQFVPDDPPTARLEQLEAPLARAARPKEDVAFFADLLSLPVPDRHPLPTLSLK